LGKHEPLLERTGGAATDSSRRQSCFRMPVSSHSCGDAREGKVRQVNRPGISGDKMI